MKLFVLVVFFVWIKDSFGQNSKEDAINSIFSNNSFLQDYEEVTHPPLKSIGALPKCGEGEQRNRFVCVPYYNCDPDTKTVQANSDIDGANKIDIRLGDEEDPQCEHYLDICCQLPASSGGGDNGGKSPTIPPTRPPTQPPTQPPTRPPTRPVTPVTPPIENPSGNSSSRLLNCGMRNSGGLDFTLIGGSSEANFGEFPWMVAILKKNPGPGENLAICGGSLITPRVILTGAHCVVTSNVNDIKVRAGEWDTQTQNERIPYQERNVAQKIVHSHFIKQNLYNDMALLILDRPFTKTDSIGTVCLPQQNQHFDSRECFATGWGKNIFGREGRYSVILKKLQLPLVHNEPCQRALRKTRLGDSFILHKTFICAGGEPNLDTCTGDGGSPLVCPDPNNPGRYLQVGVVAWGIGCGESQIPGVYVDVANFRNWVDTRLQEVGINNAPYTQ